MILETNWEAAWKASLRTTKDISSRNHANNNFYLTVDKITKNADFLQWTPSSMTASEKQPLLGNPICSAQQRRIWHWHIWCKLMNRSAASDLCSLDICPFLLWWIGARSTDGETAEDWDQDPEGGWLREGCCHLKPSQEVRKNGCLCSASHYCISTSSIRRGSADPCETHTCCRFTDTVKPVGTVLHCSNRKGRWWENRGFGKAMLPACWWVICTLTCRLCSLYAVSFATAALTVS